MKYLVIGDPHFKVSNANETIKFVKKVIEICKKHSPDKVILLGDILDTHEKIHMQPLVRSCAFILKLAKKYQVYVIIGNHDRPNNNVYLTDEHPFVGLKNTPNIKIIENVLIEGDIAYVPYVANGRFKEALLTQIELDDIKNLKLIFAHQEFRGCKLGGIISTDGDVWEEDLPLIISGHIHDHHIPQCNILYAGTPFQHSFGDSSKKGILLLEDDNLKDKIWNDNYKFIKLDIVKKKIIKLNIEELYQFDRNDYPDTILKLEIEGEASTIKKLLQTEEFKEKLKGISIKVKGNKVEKFEIKRGITFKDYLESVINESDNKLRKEYKEIFVI